MMTKKAMWISTGIYLFCTVLWTANFFLHWYQDGIIETSTALFGVAAVCFAVAGVMGLIRVRHMPKEEK